MSTTSDQTDYKQLLSFIMHELRHINAMIRDSARQLSLATRGNRVDEVALRHHAAVVVEQSAALSSWLAIADMHIDPDRFAKEPLRRVSLHEIFFKALANFKRLLAAKHISSVLNGEGKFYVTAHPVIDIMPYVLLDNAVKYSPDYGNITVTLREESAMQHISVESMGPRLDDEERSSLFRVGFRGKYAKQRTEVGTGQGLALLKTICDYHSARIAVTSGSGEGTAVNNVPFARFTVDIQIPRA